MKQMKIVFKDGRAVIEVSGCPGTSCQDFSRPFESAFGHVVTSTPNDEMYMEETDQDHQELGDG